MAAVPLNAVPLNEWERQQIETIDKLLVRARLRYITFERDHLKLNETATTDADKEAMKKLADTLVAVVPQRLRYFVIDLYSVLDYLCFLCFCHFQNGGKPDYSSKSRNVKFPYSEKLRTSLTNEDELNMKSKIFAEKHYKVIFDSEFSLNPPGSTNPSTYNQRWDSFMNFILNCQSVTVKNAGKACTQTLTDEGKCFSQLYHLRNRCTHRDLVNVSVETGYLNIEKNSGIREFTPQSKNDPNWESLEIAKGIWLHLPQFGEAGEETMVLKPLTHITDLIEFVVQARNELLKIAFGLDEAGPNTDDPYKPKRFNMADRIRHGYIDGVLIVKEKRRYTWDEFERFCCHTNDSSHLWAV